MNIGKRNSLANLQSQCQRQFVPRCQDVILHFNPLHGRRVSAALGPSWANCVMPGFFYPAHTTDNWVNETIRSVWENWKPFFPLSTAFVMCVYDHNWGSVKCLRKQLRKTRTQLVELPKVQLRLKNITSVFRNTIAYRVVHLLALIN